MNICFFSPSVPPRVCGVGDYTASIAGRISKEHQVSYIHAENIHDSFKNIRYYRLCRPFGIQHFFKILRFLRNQQTDIFHIQYQNAMYENSVFLCMLPLFLRIFFPGLKIFVTYHDLDSAPFFSNLKIPGLRKLDIILMAFFSHCSILTNDEDYYRRIFRYIPGRHSLIPIGVNLFIESDLQKSSIRVRRGISFFGKIYRNKRIEILIEAVALCKEELHIVGYCEDEEYQKELQELSDKMNISSFVHWYGAQPPEKVLEIVGRTIACVVPFRGGASLRRGSLLGAMACGVPCITEKNDQQKYFKNRHNCILIDLTPSAISNAVSLLKENTELHEHICNEMKQVIEYVSWGSIVKKHLEYYNYFFNQKR